MVVASPVTPVVPSDFRIDGWALISTGDGHNVQHIHQKGWATGIYYPSAVEGAGGDLVIGRPESAAGSDQDWAQRKLSPEVGTLILMPSFYTHWTQPLQGAGKRTAIAFDVLPNEATLEGGGRTRART